MDPERPYTMQASPWTQLIGRLEETKWLDQAADAVTEWLAPLERHPTAPRVKDFLHGRWLGHALHPVLTDLPVGLWTGSLLLDLVGARKSAGLINAAGSMAAVATAVTGLADWTTTDGRERRLGLAHGLLNTAGLGLQLMSLGARLRRRPRRALRLSALGWSVSSIAAYIGGELVFGRGIMVNHDAWVAGPTEWTAVIASAELPEGAPKKISVAGRNLLLYRKGAQISAMEDACAHAGGPLSEGQVEADIVTCPWHGSRFRLTDGAVLQGPACFPQVRLETRTRAGRVEVRGRQG